MPQQFRRDRRLGATGFGFIAIDERQGAYEVNRRREIGGRRTIEPLDENGFARADLHYSRFRDVDSASESEPHGCMIGAALIEGVGLALKFGNPQFAVDRDYSFRPRTAQGCAGMVNAVPMGWQVSQLRCSRIRRRSHPESSGRTCHWPLAA